MDEIKSNRVSPTITSYSELLSVASKCLSWQQHVPVLLNRLLLPCYLVPSSRVRLLVINMTIFLHASRSLAKPHSSVSVQFVATLMSSSQRARGLPLFLVGHPPPIPNVIDFSKLFSLRMICPKYNSCCFFQGFVINVSSGLVALISSITGLKSMAFVAVFSSTTTQRCRIFFSLRFLSSDSQP